MAGFGRVRRLCYRGGVGCLGAFSRRSVWIGRKGDRVRLTAEQYQAIRWAAREAFEEEARVRLFGSRVDDTARGYKQLSKNLPNTIRT